MENEWARLLSFRLFPPDSPMFTQSLATAGFFYTGTVDEAQCFSCSFCHKNWKPGDSPIDIHRTNSPQCKFIKGENGKNIPIHGGACYPPSLLTNAAAGTGDNTQLPTRRPGADMESNITKIMRDKSFRHMSKRQQSFSNWKSSVQDPRNLAEAGLVYTGVGDKVCCHVCGVVIEQWKPSDIPFEEHERLSPGCQFTEIHRPATKREAHQANSSIMGSNALSFKSSDPVTASSNKSSDPVTALSNKSSDPVTASSNKPSVQKAAFTHQNALSAYHESLPSYNLSMDLYSLDSALWEYTARSVEDDNRRLIKEKKELQQQLEERDEQLDRLKHCKLCFSHDMNVTFIPCGHIMCCKACSEKVGNKCPICRTPITTKQKSYIAWE